MKREISELPLNEESKKSYRGKRHLQDSSFRSRPLQDTMYKGRTQCLYPPIETEKVMTTNNFLRNSRPQSKQDQRRPLCKRPQTSKGTRGYDHRHKENQHEEEGSVREVEIITNCCRPKPPPANLRSQFETDLDDEFLGLFAN